jgi:hypothetical protein
VTLSNALGPTIFTPRSRCAGAVNQSNNSFASNSSWSAILSNAWSSFSLSVPSMVESEER